MKTIIQASLIDVFDNRSLGLQGITDCEGDGYSPSLSKRRKNALQGETDAISAVEGV